MALQDWRMDAGMQQVHTTSAAPGVEALHACPTWHPAQTSATVVRHSAGPGPSVGSHSNLHRPSSGVDGQGAAAQSVGLPTHHTSCRQQPVLVSRTSFQGPATTPNAGADSPKPPAEGLLRQKSGSHSRPADLFGSEHKVVAMRQPLQDLLRSSSEQRFGRRTADHYPSSQGKQVSRQTHPFKPNLPSKDALTAAAGQKPRDNPASTAAVLLQTASSKDQYAQLVQSHTEPAQAHSPEQVTGCGAGMPAGSRANACVGQPNIAAADQTAISHRLPVSLSSTRKSVQLHAPKDGQSAGDLEVPFQASLAAYSSSSSFAVLDNAAAVSSGSKFPTNAAEGSQPIRTHSAEHNTSTGPGQESVPALGVLAVQQPSEIAIQQIGQAVAPSQQSQRLHLHTTAVADPKSHTIAPATLEEPHAPSMPSPVQLSHASLQPAVHAKASLEQAESTTLPHDLQRAPCHLLPSELRNSDVKQLVPSAPSHAALLEEVHPGAEHPHHAPPEPSKSTIGHGMPGSSTRATCLLFHQPPPELATDPRPMWDANCSPQSVFVPIPAAGCHAAKSAMRVAGADPVPPLDHGDVQNDPACSEASSSDIPETIVMAEQQPLTEQEQLSGLDLHEHAECAASPPAAETSQCEAEGVLEQSFITSLQQQPERPQGVGPARSPRDQMSPQLKVPHPILQLGLA